MTLGFNEFKFVNLFNEFELFPLRIWKLDEYGKYLEFAKCFDYSELPSIIDDLFESIESGESVEDVEDTSTIHFRADVEKCLENISNVVKSLKTEVYFYVLTDEKVFPLFFYDRGFIILEHSAVLMCYFYMIILREKTYLVPVCTEVMFDETYWECLEYVALLGVAGATMRDVFNELKLGKYFTFNNELKCYELKTSTSTFLKNVVMGKYWTRIFIKSILAKFPRS